MAEKSTAKSKLKTSKTASKAVPKATAKDKSPKVKFTGSAPAAGKKPLASKGGEKQVAKAPVKSAFLAKAPSPKSSDSKSDKAPKIAASSKVSVSQVVGVGVESSGNKPAAVQLKTVPTEIAKATPGQKPDLDKKKEQKAAAKKEAKKSGRAVEPAISSEDLEKFLELKEKWAKENAPTYQLSGQYEAGKPLQHKILGWGFVMGSLNDRLEVLFETGRKILISNYGTKEKHGKR